LTHPSKPSVLLGAVIFRDSPAHRGLRPRPHNHEIQQFEPGHRGGHRSNLGVNRARGENIPQPDRRESLAAACAPTRRLKQHPSRLRPTSAVAPEGDVMAAVPESGGAQAHRPQMGGTTVGRRTPEEAALRALTDAGHPVGEAEKKESRHVVHQEDEQVKVDEAVSVRSFRRVCRQELAPEWKRRNQE